MIWLNDQLDFPFDLADGWGPATLEGLTLVTQGTALPVAVTLTGYTVQDRVDGRIQFGFGHDAGTGSDPLAEVVPSGDGSDEAAGEYLNRE